MDKRHDAGVAISELAGEHNASTATIYQWRAKYRGMDTSMMKHLNELHTKSTRLRKMYAEEHTLAEIRKEAVEETLYKL